MITGIIQHECAIQAYPSILVNTFLGLISHSKWWSWLTFECHANTAGTCFFYKPKWPYIMNNFTTKKKRLLVDCIKALHYSSLPNHKMNKVSPQTAPCRKICGKIGGGLKLMAFLIGAHVCQSDGVTLTQLHTARSLPAHQREWADGRKYIFPGALRSLRLACVHGQDGWCHACWSRMFLGGLRVPWNCQVGQSTFIHIKRLTSVTPRGGKYSSTVSTVLRFLCFTWVFQFWLTLYSTFTTYNFNDNILLHYIYLNFSY